MSLAKKFLLATVCGILLLSALGVLGWREAQRYVARNEHAPHLVRVNEPAEDFQFHTLDGAPRRLSAHRGKVVFVDLWGTWCIQCVAEMPALQKLYDRYRNDPEVTFLIISRMDTPDTVRRFARRHGYDLPFYIMRDADIPASMQLRQFPTTFLYARDGSVAAKHTGAADWSAPAVAAFIESLKKSSNDAYSEPKPNLQPLPEGPLT